MLALLALLACTSTHEEAPSVAAPAEPAPAEVTPAEPAADLTPQALAQARTELGLRLLAALSEDNRGNLALSPASLGHALTMTWAGARGATASQLAEVLTLPSTGPEVHAAAAALKEAAQLKEDGVALASGSRLWAQQGLSILPDYQSLTESSYGAPLATLDFGGDPEAARGEINGWVSEQTLEHIPELLPQGSVTDQTRLVLSDALYFKGAWSEPFDPKQTETAPFTLESGEAVDVSMMRRTGRMQHAQLSGVQVARVPYGDGRLSMVLLLPDAPGALAELETKLDAATLDALIGGGRARQVTLSLPKISLRSATSLADPLIALGAKDAFSRSADFSGITGDDGLYLTAVLHEVTLDVDEEGTVATAATAVVAATKSAPMPPTEMRLDRPFLFLIQDRQTGAVLFLGRVADPRG